MRKKRKVKNWTIVFIFSIFVILFVFSSYKVIMWKLNVDKNNNINKEIIKKNIKIDNNEKNKKYKYNVDFESLKKQNPDTVAYLKVNGTNIDYVVVKGKDNSYYLKHNFNKEYNIAGWIFADYKNKFDGTDKNIVVFGHNTKDGSMFGTLKNVLSEDWQNNKDNLQITFVTERKEYLYQVFSTYSIKPEEYYIKTDFESNDEYIEFLNELKERSNHDYKVDISPNDTILTLSSCIGDGSKRVVLHAKKIY
ncbi:MAG: class B sortase [Bacilli bacterium]|nr:class B sortase [Bacilli bacterium]